MSFKTDNGVKNNTVKYVGEAVLELPLGTVVESITPNFQGKSRRYMIIGWGDSRGGIIKKFLMHISEYPGMLNKPGMFYDFSNDNNYKETMNKLTFVLVEGTVLTVDQ